MDLPFGELILPYSRAVDMEANFSDPVELGYELRWAGRKLSVDKPRALVVAFGPDAAAFIKIHGRLNERETASLNIHRKYNGAEGGRAAEKPCSSISFLRAEDDANLIVCIVQSLVDDQVAMVVTEKIFNCFNEPPEMVYVLLALPNMHYASYDGLEVNEDSTFLRHLACGSAASDNEDYGVICSRLVGNMISHLPAAVLAYCDVRSIPAVAFVTYKSSSFETVEGVRCFLPVCGLTRLKRLFEKVDPEEIQRRLQRLFIKGGASSHLYL